MITVTIFKDKQGYITGYKTEGHAEAMPETEFDLVCNTVSVLTQTPLMGLERHLQCKPFYRVNEVDGVLEVKLNSKPNDLTQAILATMEYGLQSVVRQYSEYIRIQEYRR